VAVVACEEPSSEHSAGRVFGLRRRGARRLTTRSQTGTEWPIDGARRHAASKGAWMNNEARNYG
jgi:hypothetical protein